MIIRKKIVLVFLLPALLVGCGGSSEERLETVEVTGTLSLDGKPYAGPAAFSLVPKKGDGRGVSAILAEDGTFTTMTYEEGDGAVPGEYVAKLVPDPMTMEPVPLTKPYPVTIPSEGPVELDIKLEAAPGGRKGMPGMQM